MSTFTPPTFEILSQVLEEKFGVLREDIKPDTVLEDIELDSLALIEVALTLQKQLGVAIPTEDLNSSGTVSDLYELVNTAAEKA
ncbi:acyl carrier protein [Streptomyces sp. NPDC050264]|uniref:acyl carrier protein n=1 Tax=Streptomyces sp. NPDC050264 TaxID=3155038 RepID=UPI0034421F39